MKNRVNKFLSLAAVLLLSLSFVLSAGCNKGNGGSGGQSDKTLQVWTAGATERIFRDQSDMDTSQKIMRISMAINEYEGAQLMLRADYAAGSYNVEVTDLVCGDKIISKENISIYNAKYFSSVGVSSKYNNASMPAGSEVPDALLPFDVAVEYGENKLEKDKNQSVYIEVYTPKEAFAGLYEGKINLYIDGKKYVTSILVTVNDYTIPDEPNTANYMARWGREHYASAELDCTDEMDEIYFEQMLKYRMSSSLPFEGEGGTERYVELLRKYYTQPGFSAYKFYYEATYSSYNDILIAYNVPLCKEYIKAVAKASVEDGVDYLKKAFFYFSTFVDEPDTNPSVTWEMVRNISVTVQKMLEDVAVELDVLLADCDNFAFYEEEVRGSILAMPNVIPGSYSINLLEENGAEDITACISLDLFDSESNRNMYNNREGMQSWWYTCIGPQYPYPNVLANNWPVGVRLISWMQNAYDIDAFLVWECVNYTSADDNGLPIIDNYSYLTDTMTGVADGKLFYPGAPYGIKGPVPSFRAVAYRDGMEDYEILEGINAAYEEQGLTADDALENIYSSLFNGAVTIEDSKVFEAVREQAFELLNCATGDFAVYWSEIESDGNQATVSFKVPNANATVAVKGATLEEGENGNYVGRMNLSESSTISVTVTVKGESVTYTKYINGKYASIADFEDGTTNAVRVNGSSNVELSNEMSTSGSKSLKVTLNGKTGEDAYTYKPWFSVSAAGMGDVSKVGSLIFDIYSDEACSFNVIARYGNVTTYEQAVTGISINKGWNRLELNIPTTVKNLENVQEFRFRTDNILNEDGTAGSRIFYVDQVGYRVAGENDQVKKYNDAAISYESYSGTVYSGNKQNLVIANDVSNVVEGDYLMLGDFENYNQIAQIMYANNFGKVELCSDGKYVTHGNSAIKLTITGFGENQRHFDPIMIFSTLHDYFQKTDFSNVDYLEVDMYNAMDYDVTVRFMPSESYYVTTVPKQTIVLKPGANKVVIDLNAIKDGQGSAVFNELCFVFERGELFDGPRVIYMDNFRAHIVK